ncbi:hypothetical protein MYAM1_003147 [Malassezia yamatoensis]|uniref:3-phytase A n=1 Tax=Malassezia yamatoensis TaxID=253288 RepID=A0AAJ5YV80_9BASI|nr:hypothetical protein MYAM1_003147 [Malassezia yamatoensis]
MAGDRPTRDRGDSQEEEQQLMNGIPVAHSVPSQNPRDAPYDEESLHHAPNTKLDDGSDDLGKTGRPDWLTRLDLDQLPRELRRPVLALGGVVMVFILFGVFYFALGPRAEDSSHSSTSKHNEKVIWNADQKPSFGTDIGYPGTFKTGSPPEFAQEMVPMSRTRGVSPIQTGIVGYDEKFNPFQHMGPLSPYFSADFQVDNGKYLATPTGANGTCTLTQVHILHRHGARYPTGGSPTELVRDMVKQRGVAFTGPLTFLNMYEYRLGAELLVPLGRQQLHMSGVKSAIDYGKLAEIDLASNKKLFVRTGSQQRIVDSALAWITGFWGNGWMNKTDFEVQIEEPHFNTTLAPNFACEAAVEAHAEDNVNKYLAKTTERLNHYVHGAQLTPMIVYGMQQLCSYDTVAYGQSAFCALFSEEDWRGYEFTWDHRFFYSYGSGAATGPGMGLGWLNEFVSRLTHTPWNASYQTSENATFNTDPHLFPIDHAIYADFTHDSVLTSVLAALNLTHLAKPPREEDQKRGFRTSHLVPFSARMIFEKFQCGQQDTDIRIRMRLNDAIVSLSQLSKCDKREDGLCTLPQFLASLESRNDQGWWDQCQL